MLFFKSSENLINKWIEILYLSSILLIPIAFSPENILGFYQLPKEFILHLSGTLIFMLIILKLIIDPKLLISKIIQYKFAFGFLFILLISTIISAIFSINPNGSFWGREYGTSGYSVHTIFSLITISSGIIINSDQENHQKKLLLTIILSTTIVSFFGLIQNFTPAIFPTFTFYHQDRIVSTLGNPIYLGSFLLMGTLLSIFYFLKYKNISTNNRLLFIYIILISIQVSCLFLTLSRGPIVGFFIGYLSIGISYSLLNIKSVVKVLIIFLLPLLLSIIIINIPRGESKLEYFDELVERTGSLSGELDLSVDIESGINIKMDPSSFNYRGENWIAAAKLVRYWPKMLTNESQYFRSLFGYGPDTFVYTYPITVPIQEKIVVSNHAHNIFLNTIVENGFIGLIILIGMLIYLARLLINGFNNSIKEEKFIYISLASILAGRLFEQMLGLAVLQDLLLFYILISLIVVSANNKNNKPISYKINFDSALTKSSVVIISILSVALISTLSLKDYQSARSGFYLGNGLTNLNKGNIEEAIKDLEKASRLNTRSTAIETEIFKISYKIYLYGTANPGNRNTTREKSLLPLMYSRLSLFNDQNPYSFNGRNFISKVTWQMAKSQPDLFRDESINNYIYLRNLMPAYLDVQEVLANVLIATGYMDEARQEIDLALLMAESRGFTSPQSYWLKGELEKFEGNTEEAIKFFNTSIDLCLKEKIKLEEQTGDPEYFTNSIYKFLVLSHQSLALIYEFTDYTKGNFHLSQAQKIALNSGNVLLLEKRFQ